MGRICVLSLVVALGATAMAATMPPTADVGTLAATYDVPQDSSGDVLATPGPARDTGIVAVDTIENNVDFQVTHQCAVLTNKVVPATTPTPKPGPVAMIDGMDVYSVNIINETTPLLRTFAGTATPELSTMTATFVVGSDRTTGSGSVGIHKSAGYACTDGYALWKAIGRDAGGDYFVGCRVLIA